MDGKVRRWRSTAVSSGNETWDEMLRLLDLMDHNLPSPCNTVAFASAILEISEDDFSFHLSGHCVIPSNDNLDVASSLEHV